MVIVMSAGLLFPPQVLDEYNDIMRKLIGKPVSIEHIVETKEFMESAPYIIKALEETTRRLLFVSKRLKSIGTIREGLVHSMQNC